MTVLTLAEPAKIDANSIQQLRDVLALAEAGKVKGFVVAYEDDDLWCFVWGATRAQCVLLSDLAHARAMDRLKE